MPFCINQKTATQVNGKNNPNKPNIKKAPPIRSTKLAIFGKKKRLFNKNKTNTKIDTLFKNGILKKSKYSATKAIPVKISNIPNAYFIIKTRFKEGI